MVDTSFLQTTHLTRDELVSGLRALRSVFAREGVVHMMLFGSRARGDNRAHSDIDLMIEVDAVRKFSLVELSRVSLIVEDRFGLPAAIVMRRSANPAMLAAADRDGIALF